jgi:hypothetical protein
VLALTGWLLLQSFASGCTAMTGVEAVSNGVRAFRDPAVKNARITLTIIIAILAVLLLGIAFLVRAYGIGATPPGESGYESVLSQLIGAVAGKGIFYYVASASILLVLALSANTAFADFPRLCRIIARDRFLPKSFASRGRRLVFSNGVYALTLIAGVLLVIFKGVTDRLIPLYAVGAFLAFTLSQAGMVAHWKRSEGRHYFSMLLNGLGALATGVTTLVVMVAKFVEGAWITLALIPVLFFLMKAVRRQYEWMEKEIALHQPLDLTHLHDPIVIVPVDGWHRITQKALRLALLISPEVQALHIHTEGSPSHLASRWKELVEAPAKHAGLPVPALKVVRSPYRHVLTPILEYVTAEAKRHPDRHIAVIIPEKVLNRWYHYFLYNRRGALLKTLLYFAGNPQIVVTNVPWYFGKESSKAIAPDR